MKLDTKFNIGDTVLLKHDFEMNKRVVTGISIRGDKGQVHSYNLMSGQNDSWHYEFELELYQKGKQKIAGFTR